MKVLSDILELSCVQSPHHWETLLLMTRDL